MNHDFATFTLFLLRFMNHDFATFTLFLLRVMNHDFATFTLFLLRFMIHDFATFWTEMALSGCEDQPIFPNAVTCCFTRSLHNS
jgi:hypothetical protein